MPGNKAIVKVADNKHPCMWQSHACMASDFSFLVQPMSTYTSQQEMVHVNKVEDLFPKHSKDESDCKSVHSTSLIAVKFYLSTQLT